MDIEDQTFEFEVGSVVIQGRGHAEMPPDADPTGVDDAGGILMVSEGARLIIQEATVTHRETGEEWNLEPGIYQIGGEDGFKRVADIARSS